MRLRLCSCCLSWFRVKFLFPISPFCHNPYYNLQNAHHIPCLSMYLITTFHTFPCNGLPHKLFVKYWFCQNTLSLLKECLHVYSITQLHKVAAICLIKMFHCQGHLPWAFSNCQYCLPTSPLKFWQPSNRSWVFEKENTGPKAGLNTG